MGVKTESSASLNPQQRLAVETVEGRVLILAGAGSGKTTVLTRRMAHLIEHHGISPRAILGMTFTNKAAAEMRQRLACWLGSEVASQVCLSTFHSFCVRVLRSHIYRLGYSSTFTIYDEADVSHLIGRICREILNTEGEVPSLTPTIRAITSARSRGMGPNELHAESSSWHDKFFVRQVYERFLERMKEHNALDFDGILFCCLDLFQRFPEVLQEYQERYRYLMIDEYQDTNAVQGQMTLLLANKYGNLCVVGDDDQSIYGWRGADVKNILQFEGATIIRLEQNYRSTNVILKAANAVIKNNQDRHDKELWSDKEMGSRIAIFHVADEMEEAVSVVRRMTRMKDLHGLRWSDFAILYRSNALSRHFEMVLMKSRWFQDGRVLQGIPYQVTGGLEFQDRKEVRDLMAYLRMIVNPKDAEALYRVVNLPKRGIGEGSLALIDAYGKERGMCLWDVLRAMASGKVTKGEFSRMTSKTLQGVKEFVETIEEAQSSFADQAPEEAFQKLLEKIRFKELIAEEAENRQQQQLKWDNVEEMTAALQSFGEEVSSEGGALVAEFVTTMQLQLQRRHALKDQAEQEDKVNLLTFHSAKGLEFTACFLVGIEDHIIPHARSLQDSAEGGESRQTLEEERRLMYVAMTRAKRFLTVSMAHNRRRGHSYQASRPSRFLFEIPKELLHSVNSTAEVDEQMAERM